MRASLFVVVALALGPQLAAKGEIRYTITRIGPDAPTSTAYCINDQSDVGGFAGGIGNGAWLKNSNGTSIVSGATAF